MIETPKDKIKHDITYYFYKNYRNSFYKLNSNIDNRANYNKYKVIGYKMNINDFEQAIENIISSSNLINNNNNNINNNYNNTDNIISTITNNIINFNNSYDNYELIHLYFKMKNKIKPGTNFSLKSFEKKYNYLKMNNNNPFYLLLFPNYEWSNLIITFN